MSSSNEAPHFGSVEELNSKYSKLASEYTKLRAQYSVVKKAVIDEKSKREELSDILKAKETSLRKAEAEMDSLEFRNNQLTKRIQLLQSESSTTPKQPSSPNGGGDVFSEELHHKIKENEDLQSKLDSIHGEYASKMDNYEQRISELELEIQKVRRSESQLIEMVNGLKEEKITVTERMKSLESDLRQQSTRNSTKTLPSASSASISSNYNFPLTPTDIRVQTVELLGSVGEQIQEFVASSSDFHTYWERRLNGGSPELSKLLKNNVESLKPLELSFQALLSDALDKEGSESSGIKKLASAFHDYVKYYRKLESLFTFQLEEGSTSVEKYRVSRYLKSYGSCLEDAALKLNEFSSNIKSGLGLENLVISVSTLHRESIELSKSFVCLMDSERQIAPDNIKDNNSCIAAALSNLSSGLNSLSRILSDNLTRIGILVKASKTEMEAQNVVLAQEEPSTPSEMDHLKEEIKNVNELAERLEKELKKNLQSKEHWKLEFELLEMKYNKLKESEKAEDEGVSASDEAEDIKSLYKSKLDELVSEKLLADSKATSFYLETVTLGKRLKCLENYKSRMEREIYNIREDREKLSEEMNTTSSNYELQLSMMSEHLADMNDKLSSQTDQINHLKYELSHPKSSKSKK